MRMCALLGVLLTACPCAFALNPSLDVSQYAHTSWKIRDGFPKGEVNSIAQTLDGWLWLGTEFGLIRFDGVTPTAFPPPPGQHLPSDNIRRLLVARDGTLWIGTTKGLASWKNGRLRRYAELGETFIDTMLEDREGSIWVGLQGPGKLCAIRDGRVRCEGEGRLGPGVLGLHASPNGTLWVGMANGLWRWKPGPPRFYSLPGEINGILAFADEDNGALTIGTHSGLMRFADTASEPHAVPGVATGLAVNLLLRDRDGGQWLGTSSQGLVHLHQGLVDVFGPREGLSGDDVFALFEDREGNLWVSTDNGLDRFRDYAVATFSQNRLYMPCGLVRIARAEMDEWNNDARHTIRFTLFDSSDGVRTVARPGGFTPHVTKSPDGKIWFAAMDGASVVDPLHLAVNKLPPPVYVGQITADRKVYDASPDRHLPPLVRDLEIDYTALSLVAPEKNRFKYKLEGYDADWQDAGTRRQAFYTNLSPHNYRFRVMASNNSGVRNEAGAAFDFSIDPAWYQTLWFLAAAVAAFFAVLLGLYRYRLHQMSRQFGMRMEERVNERTRIARDLHDTLLQGFQGVLLKFSAVSYMLPDHSQARDVRTLR